MLYGGGKLKCFTEKKSFQFFLKVVMLLVQRMSTGRLFHAHEFILVVVGLFCQYHSQVIDLIAPHLSCVEWDVKLSGSLTILDTLSAVTD